MATLSSSSSDATVQAEYDNCASYAEDASADKARRFVTACRIKIGRSVQSSAGGSTSLSLPVAEWRQQLQAAQSWLAANDTARGTGGVTYYSFGALR